MSIAEVIEMRRGYVVRVRDKNGTLLYFTGRFNGNSKWSDYVDAKVYKTKPGAMRAIQKLSDSTR